MIFFAMLFQRRFLLDFAYNFMGIKSCFLFVPKQHFIPEITFYTGNNILYRKADFPFCALRILENNPTFLWNLN